MTPDAVAREILLPATPTEVWEALTDGSRVSEWFGAEVEMSARLGGRVRFRWGDGRERSAVIETYEPERLLVLRWLPFELDAGGKTRTRPTTTVRFTVGPREKGTLLEVQETSPSPLGEARSAAGVTHPEKLGPAGLHAGAGAGT